MSQVHWASADERNELKSFCEKVGYELLEERSVQKSWSEERRLESRLGYGDFQRLIAFPYSVPKSTLTLLWASSSDRKWKPLFPVME